MSKKGILGKNYMVKGEGTAQLSAMQGSQDLLSEFNFDDSGIGFSLRFFDKGFIAYLLVEQSLS